MKLFRGVVRWKEILQRRQALRFTKWQRAQQQRIDNAEDAGVGANADGERQDREPRVPGTAGPKPQRVSRILIDLSGELDRDRYRQIG